MFFEYVFLFSLLFLIILSFPNSINKRNLEITYKFKVSVLVKTHNSMKVIKICNDYECSEDFTIENNGLLFGPINAVYIDDDYKIFIEKLNDDGPFVGAAIGMIEMIEGNILCELRTSSLGGSSYSDYILMPSYDLVVQFTHIYEWDLGTEKIFNVTQKSSMPITMNYQRLTARYGEEKIIYLNNLYKMDNQKFFDERCINSAYVKVNSNYYSYFYLSVNENGERIYMDYNHLYSTETDTFKYISYDEESYNRYLYLSLFFDNYQKPYTFYIYVRNCPKGCFECEYSNPYNCSQCQNDLGYYPVETGEYKYSCLNVEEAQEKIPSYYLSNEKIFKKCYKSCASCSGEGNDQYHRCNKCSSFYYPVEGENPNNCYKAWTNEHPNYYYNDSLRMYKKCYSKCASCVKGGDENTNNCLSCVQPYYLFSEQNKCTINAPDGYYYDLTTKSIKQCFSRCKTCERGGTYTDTNCISCNSFYYPLEDKPSQCQDTKPRGYYLYTDYNTNQYKYNRCPIANCAICDEIRNGIRVCSECFHENGYYLFKNDTHTLCEKELIGYRPNDDGYTLEKCTDYCEKCNSIECLKCIEKIKIFDTWDINNASYAHFTLENKVCNYTCDRNGKKINQQNNGNILLLCKYDKNDCQKIGLNHYDRDNLCYKVCPEDKKYNNSYECSDKCPKFYDEKNDCYNSCKESPISPYYNNDKKCVSSCKGNMVPYNNECTDKLDNISDINSLENQKILNQMK